MAAATAALAPEHAMAQTPLLTRKIPSSGEAIPVVGLGTSVYETGPLTKRSSFTPPSHLAAKSSPSPSPL